MTTEQTFHPIKKFLLEERDYKVSGLFLHEIRRFSYDDHDRIVGINYYNKNDRLLFGTEFLYNEKGQRFAEIRKSQSQIKNRTFHLFNKDNKIIASYGELDNGHQYYHEYAYNNKGEQIVLSMSSLRNDIDLYEIYKIGLKERQLKEITKENLLNSQAITSHSWTCGICSGDEGTGCQWFDPTECPKFT